MYFTPNHGKRKNIMLYNVINIFLYQKFCNSLFSISIYCVSKYFKRCLYLKIFHCEKRVEINIMLSYPIYIPIPCVILKNNLFLFSCKKTNFSAGNISMTYQVNYAKTCVIPCIINKLMLLHAWQIEKISKHLSHVCEDKLNLIFLLMHIKGNRKSLKVHVNN